MVKKYVHPLNKLLSIFSHKLQATGTWRPMFGMGLLFPCLQLAFFKLISESPYWKLMTVRLNFFLETQPNSSDQISIYKIDEFSIFVC